MKIRIYSPERDRERTITIPTGFLFSRVGMYFAAKLMSSAARKEYEKKLAEMWRNGSDDLDDFMSVEDVQKAERLTPPISEEQARELFAALRDSKYVMGGLPLMSLESDEIRVRLDL